MSDTTNINDLPASPSSSGNNITLEMKENPIARHPMITDSTPINRGEGPPNTNINKIVSGIQTAAAANLTALPARDIPMITHGHTQDQQSRPNYVPQPQKQTDYIGQYDSIQSMMQKKQKHEVKEDRLEHIYEEMQIPIFVMILFLFFQLPSFQKILYRQLPYLFASDGHPKFAGYLFKTLLFGGSFYFIQKGTKYLSQT